MTIASETKQTETKFDDSKDELMQGCTKGNDFIICPSSHNLCVEPQAMGVYVACYNETALDLLG